MYVPFLSPFDVLPKLVFLEYVALTMARGEEFCASLPVSSLLACREEVAFAPGDPEHGVLLELQERYIFTYGHLARSSVRS